MVYLAEQPLAHADALLVAELGGEGAVVGRGPVPVEDVVGEKGASPSGLADGGVDGEARGEEAEGEKPDLEGLDGGDEEEKGKKNGAVRESEKDERCNQMQTAVDGEQVAEAEAEEGMATASRNSRRSHHHIPYTAHRHGSQHYGSPEHHTPCIENIDCCGTCFGSQRRVDALFIQRLFFIRRRHKKRKVQLNA